MQRLVVDPLDEPMGTTPEQEENPTEVFNGFGCFTCLHGVIHSLAGQLCG